MANDKYLFVVSGAAGTGKDSVVKALREAHPEIEKTVSATTRAPRPGEQEGVDYYYRTREQFQQLIENDQVVEHNFYNGNYYGTLREEVDKRLAARKVVVLVIDVHGAANIRRMFPGATTVFLLPPSVEELERRLRGRGTETEDSIQERLATARQELAQQDKFTLKLVNDQVDTCADALYQAICQRIGAAEYHCEGAGRMPKTVGVAVSNATFHFDKLYTYAVMPDQQNAVKLGSMVLVPFGRGSRARMGVVLACDAEPESAKLKYLFDVAPASACLTPELLRLVHFLKERTFCTYYEAVKAVIPYGAQYKPAVAADGVTPVLQKQLTRHTENSYRLVGGLPPKPKPTAKQLAAVALLGGGPRTLNELEDKGISRAVLDNLCAKGVLECSKVNKSIDLYSSIPLKNEPITLTQEQQAAYDALLPKLEDDAPHSALLYGVTGSGKTLVFLKLIARCLEQGRRALVLVPEISLTPQMILRLKSQFGRRVAVQHSALNHTERLLQWQMIQDGGADIVVGTRSAIFSPLENIGLIIIDEEQEHTYRSESAPRYSAHEVARQRAAENGALLLLASATPSTESFYAAQHGRTQLVRLTQRYGGNPLPTVQIVDMRAELAAGNPREISLSLEDAIRRNLDAGKQTILLLNRRGYQTMAQCEDCREVLKCTKCSVPMVYHKAAHKVLCHYCGSQMEPPTVCPACGGKLQYRGFGTQKAEEELAKLFPDARVLRMDQDSTAAKDAHEKLLARFANHEYDIMVGTQMVAKGLDFEDVTLVGVLGIDSLLFAQGFRAYENVFSLITQVVGRSGRAKDPGFAIIQTTDPDNPVLNLAAAQDYDAFFEQEIAYRKLGLYPPFCGLCVIGFAGAKEIEVARAAARFAALLGQQAAKQPDLPLRVLGPTPGSIEKINDTYRYKLTIKCRNDRRFRDLVRSTLERYEQEKLPSKATVAVDLHSDGDI